MVELTANAIQLVPSAQNIQFTDESLSGNKGCVIHRPGAGIVTLKGVTKKCSALFRVSFGANIAVPTGETVGPISLAVSINGEQIAVSTAIVTPAAVDEYFHVYTSKLIEVPKGCCYTISIENISDIPINVQNAILTVERSDAE